MTFLFALLFGFKPDASQTMGPESFLAAYEVMQENQYAISGKPLPSSGLTIVRDTATFFLESGELFFMKPTLEGRVTGFVFIGKGRFEMAIPDRWELANYRRLSGDQKADQVQTTFNRLVVRCSSPLWTDITPPSNGAPYHSTDLTGDRHKKHLFHFHDINARLVSAMGIPGDDVILADFDSEDHGWLTYSWDQLRQEESQLNKYQSRNKMEESWVSIDMDRDSQGMPSTSRRKILRTNHVDLAVDLGEADSRIRRGKPIIAQFKARLPLEAYQRETRIIPMTLRATAKVTAVTGPKGESWSFLRNPIGKRFAAFGSKIYDRSLVIIPAKPLLKGKPITIEVTYEMEITNFVSGGNWFPQPAGDYLEATTASLTFLHPKGIQVRAPGLAQPPQSRQNGLRSTWLMKQPTKLLGFSLGTSFKEEKLTFEGLPEIISFGEEQKLTTGNMVKNVAIDIAKSLDFFQYYFDMKLPVDKLYATRIESGHGQAFEGFIHLSGITYDSEMPGHSELFRAHEVAHQYWGHVVGWKTYRDQWLSESFAEYSAMMFIEATMAESGYFQDILDSYCKGLIGSSSANRFARPWQMRIPAKERARMGTIALGGRAGTAGYPGAYTMMVYQKGPVVLHMIRKVLYNVTGDPSLFRKILADFVKTYAGKKADTKAFQTLLEKHTQSSWQTFFEQWIYSNHIPTYTWKSKFKPGAENSWDLVIEVQQANVPDDFSAVLPLELTFSKTEKDKLLLVMNKPKVTQVINMPRKPKKVTLNANFDVLAVMKKE